MASSVAMSSAAAVAAQTDDPRNAARPIDLPAGPLGETLVELGDVLNVTIVAPDRIVAGKIAPAITGDYTADDALSLALAGTGLTASVANGGAILVSQSVEVVPERSAKAPRRVEDQVVVTGTRIERSAVNAPSPVDIVTAEEIDRLGLTDNTEALRFVPALNTSITLSTQGNFRADGPQNFGLATLDLRGLGTNRTLVLVNGRRHVSGVSNEATVDVSSFPSALIDRVEVLTGGGSSIYGADAVSGVVNYILKDDFEGVDYRGNVNLPTEGDGEAFFGALTVGGNFAGGRGNAVLNVEYNKQTELRVGDRTASLEGGSLIGQNNPQLAAALGVDPDFLNVVIPSARLSVAPFGPAISLTGDTIGSAGAFFNGTTQIGGAPIEQIVDPVTGEIRPRDFGAAITPTQFGAVGGDAAPAFFQNPVGSTIPDLERYFINAFADYDFTDKITGFVEAKYARNSAISTSAFAALQAVNIPVQPENPFIPDLIQDQFDSLAAQALDPSLVVTRFFFDEAASGPNENIRETFRIVGGFKGALSSALSYEVSGNYGRTDTSTIDNR
ncbi:MAG: TonB-dependent receptor, partial [Pseudomonadota bacterium]